MLFVVYMSKAEVLQHIDQQLDQARTKLFYLQQPLPELHEMLTAECDRIIRLKLLVETLMNKENEQ